MIDFQVLKTQGVVDVYDRLEQRQRSAAKA
jgi:hypothetical protein